MPELTNIIRGAVTDKKIAILGDLVADQFLKGTITRISREAPVFILRHDETETLCGAAANAAVNVAALGGAPILVGVAGADRNGELLREALIRSNVNTDLLVTSPTMQTTTKIRVLAGQHYAPRQQVIRIDYEDANKPDVGLKQQLRANAVSAAERADAIIVSDYNYGAVDEELFEAVRGTAQSRRIPLVVDSRKRLRSFTGATTATPNQEEVEQILGRELTELDCSRLREELNLEALLVTCGNKGMILAEGSGSPRRIPAIGSTVPVDVTGAGDTVIAVYTLGLAAGLSFADAATLANHAGGIVVMKKGTASVSPDELIRSLTAVPKSEAA